jgi:hypothetical protein
MSAPLHTYRVDLVEWTQWTIWLDAPSAEQAESEAQRRFSQQGNGDFKLKSCGLDYVEAKLAGPAKQQLLPLIEALQHAGRLEIAHVGDKQGGAA